VGKPVRKRLVGRLRYGWEDNIKMDFGEIHWNGMDWIDMPPDNGRLL
jgi:hypothetical protein